MHAILAEFLRIRGFVMRFFEKHSIADDRRNYTRAVCLFQKTLRETSDRLEKIYYEHVLRPQIGAVHTKARNSTVDMASLVVLLLITGRHPRGPSATPQDLFDLA